MNKKFAGIFWGAILIGFGLYAFAMTMGYTPAFADSIWVAVFAGISLAALVFYAISGWKEWGWLFPFGVFGGLAVTIALATNEVYGSVVGSPLFFGLLIPFAAAYLTDRERNRWALIPGGFMVFLALTTLLADSTGGEWIGFLFLFMAALCFFGIYLGDRSRNWALIVAYILFALSVAPAMASFGSDAAAYYGPVFLAAIALPFFVIYFRSEKYWWAIIPAGVMLINAVITVFAIAGWISEWKHGGYVNAFFMSGLAAIFAVIWLRHARPWAKIVTIVLAAFAIVSLLFSSFSNSIWPLALIALGIYILYNALKPRSAQI